MAEGNALKAMVSFFTIWRQDIDEDDMEAMNKRFYLAPVVGALIGLVLLIETTVLFWLGYNNYFGSTLFTAALVLATVYVGSRFLHFDGLADFGDGSVVSGTQEDHVRALKDTLVGAGGLGVALVVTLLNFSVYAMVPAMAIVLLAPATEILVKNAQVAAAAFGNPGNGMAGRQVSETNIRSLQVSTVISLVLVLVFAFISLIIVNTLFDYPFITLDVEASIASVVIGLVVSVIAGYLMARRANRVFGMVNGDILGATNEISRLMVMALMVLTYGLILRCCRHSSTPGGRAPAWGDAG